MQFMFTLPSSSLKVKVTRQSHEKKNTAKVVGAT